MSVTDRPLAQSAALPKLIDAANVGTRHGLTGDEARRRLARLGSNAIADVAQHPVRRALGKLWAPVPWMLEAAILLQLFLGDYVEAGVVAVLLIANAAIGFFQEGRAQATLDALKSRLALVAAVQRDGIWTTVPAATLVAGDLVKLSLGSVVAADVRLLEGSILVDQSMLTGESLPVEAGAGAETYAGALIRRGEAVGEIIATGIRTKFGRTAELVRSAKVESSEQKAILRVVRNLALFNGAVTVLLTIYALWLPMPRGDIIPLILVAVLSSIPVALPSMFTLAAAVGARALARRGVLPTSLSAVDEAGGIDILCSDKTGTLTRNELAVVSVHAMPGFDDGHVLALASLASSDGGQDPVDAAIRAAASRQPVTVEPKLVNFLPFDPAVKRAEATVREADGAVARVVKGAFAVVKDLSYPSPACLAIVDRAASQGLQGPRRRIRSSSEAANGWPYRAQRSSARRLRCADCRTHQPGRAYHHGNGRRSSDCTGRGRRHRHLRTGVGDHSPPRRSSGGSFFHLRGRASGRQVSACQSASEGRPYRRHVW